MRNVFLFLVLILPFLPVFSQAQEYSYAHYGIAEGLAGATVYSLTQDRDGFLWAGTETGLSRFDGTHFTNFTTKDGLPGVEVLQVFADSRGRVWMALLGRSVCYYYQGRIHTGQNDSLLRRIRLTGNVNGFAEDPAGNILFPDMECLHVIRADGTLLDIDSIGHLPVRDCLAVGTSASGHFLTVLGKKIVEFSGSTCISSRDISLYNFHATFIAVGSGGA